MIQVINAVDRLKEELIQKCLDGNRIQDNGRWTRPAKSFHDEIRSSAREDMVIDTGCQTIFRS
jgi:hypothetical protein